MASAAVGRVLVTGASGYIATHIVQQLLKQGYQVRGTVRSLKNAVKVKPLEELYPLAEHKLELVEADLLKAESWTEAVKDCTFVLHVASPFPAENPANEDELIKPAVDGTMNVLRAVRDTGCVKRVVLTSSVAAVCNGIDGNEGHVLDAPYTEEDWTNPDECSIPYIKSKTLAEKAAWDFVNGLPEGEKFELAVVNPVYVMGPVLCGGGDATSMAIPKRLLEYGMPGLARLNFSIVDVRDVAAAHISAMTVPEAAGKRHILSTANMWLKDMALIIQDEFKPQGYRIPTFTMPKVMVRFAGLFDKSIRMIVPGIGKVCVLDNSRMTQVLGLTPRDIKQTILDMCYNMIDKGFVKKTAKYSPRSEL